MLAGAQRPAARVGWYRVARRGRVAPRAAGRATLWTVADVTRDRERQENVFQELQHAIDYLDHAPAGFLSIDADGDVVYINATLADWLGYDLAQFGSGGLQLADIAPPNAAALLQARPRPARRVRTEVLDVDLRDATAARCRCALLPSVAFGSRRPRRRLAHAGARPPPGEDVDEAQRAAEVRFARFFNDTPMAIATRRPQRPHRAAPTRPSRGCSAGRQARAARARGRHP